MFRRTPIPDELKVQDRPPDPAEIPPGYRLKRLGPGQWGAEPFSVRWRIWGIAVLTSLLSSALSIQAMRIYHLRRSQEAVVVVNGVHIRRDRMHRDLEQRYGREYIRRMVSDELLRQFAKSRGCWPTDSQVEERYAKESRRPGFLEQLAAFDVTETGYKERLRFRLADINLIVQGVTASEADIRYFYARNTDPRNPAAQFRTPERVQVAVIATRTPQAAREALTELMRDQPWPKVVARYSVDRSRENAGLLDPIERGRSPFARNPAAEATVFRLREGERSTIVEANGKWWIVRCLRKWPASVVPLDHARRDAEMGARIEIGAARNAQRVADERRAFVERASIMVLDDRYVEVSSPRVFGAPQ